MKSLMIIIDGMADRELKAYKDKSKKTPLEIANIPNLDQMAKEGLCGLLDSLGIGKRAGSDTAILSILGYDPYDVYTGRGPLEVAGTKIKFKEDDICLRCNYATVNDDFVLLDRTAGHISEGTEYLEKTLNEIDLGVEFKLKNSAGYRCVLLLRDDDLSPSVEDATTEEGKKIEEIKPLDDDRGSIKTAKVLNEFIKKSYEILKDHPVNSKRKEEGKMPANIILPRGAGVIPRLENFYEKYGLRGAVVSGIGLVKGMGHLAGMDIIDVPEATGHIDSDFMAKGKAALDALKTHDFVLLHIEGTDEVSHDKNVKEKIMVLERVDEMIGYISRHVEDTLVTILADHTTSTDLGDHTADPAPIVLWNGDFITDKVREFTEREMYRGGLHRIRGMDVIPVILDQINKSKKFGS